MSFHILFPDPKDIPAQTLDTLQLYVSTMSIEGQSINFLAYLNFANFAQAFCNHYEFPVPIVALTFSSIRRCERLKFPSGRVAIVHDQYLGQSLNHLITVGAGDKLRAQALLVYGHKVLGECYQRLDDKILALFHSQIYHLHAGRVRHSLLEAMQDTRRMYQIAIHESFILGHELAHLALDSRRSDFDSMRQEIHNFLSDNIWYQISTKSTDDLVTNNGTINVDQLLDEMLCDTLSAQFCASWFQQLGVTPQSTLEEIWKAELNLWWLNALEHLSDAISSRDADSDHSFALQNIDIKIRHNWLDYLTYELLARDDDGEPNMAIAQKINHRYNQLRTVYFDPYFDSILNLIESSKRMKTADDAQIAVDAMAHSLNILGVGDKAFSQESYNWDRLVDILLGRKN